MRRGALIEVVTSGDYGKPRPAVVILSDFLPETDSVLVCLLTTVQRDAPLYRLPIPPGEQTGLREVSQIMVDKILSVRRTRCGPVIGRIDDATLRALGRALAFVIGIAD